jgi:hypothetical protein
VSAWNTQQAGERRSHAEWYAEQARGWDNLDAVIVDWERLRSLLSEPQTQADAEAFVRRSWADDPPAQHVTERLELLYAIREAQR